MKKCILMILLINFSISVYADDYEDMPPPGSDIPLDGGLSVLIAAGAVYGLKKIRENRNSHK